MHTNDITRACQVTMQHTQICTMHYTYGTPSTTHIYWQFSAWDGWHSSHEVVTTERPQLYQNADRKESKTLGHDQTAQESAQLASD